jgi:hypothetical protein
MNKEVFIQWFIDKGIDKDIADYLYKAVNVYERLYNKSPIATKFPLATCDLVKQLIKHE